MLLADFQSITAPRDLEVAPGEVAKFYLQFSASSKTCARVGARAQVEVVESCGDGPSELHLEVGPEAQVHWCLLSPPGAFVRHCTIGEGSSFTMVSIQRGQAQSEGKFFVGLEGPHAQAHLFSLLEGSSQEAHSLRTTVEHLAPYTTSKQRAKALLDGPSYGFFQGLIKIHQRAQGSHSSQLARGLLLSPKARAQVRPCLEVDADNVVAAHGASVGPLDPMAIFYFQSRGIPDQQARRLILEGLSREIFEHIENPRVREFAQCTPIG